MCSRTENTNRREMLSTVSGPEASSLKACRWLMRSRNSPNSISPDLSASTERSICSTSSSLHIWWTEAISAFSSRELIEPLPSLSKILNASR